MAVIQPLYFAGGRYSANADRKLLAALVKPAGDGTRLEGVIPANQGTNSMKVSVSSGMTLSVSSGLALIADASTQDVDTPGVYLAGVDTSAETVTLQNGGLSDRYDLVYAEVSETSYNIINRTVSGSTVTITTSSAHGFVAGQTVYISGIDEFYDGAYVIATASTDTFTYTKSGGTTPSSSTLLPTVQIGSTICEVSSKYLTNNVAGLNLTSNIGDQPINSLVRVKGVDSTFDGDYHLAAATTASPATTAITYKINRSPLSNVGSFASPTSVSSSSAAKARVPFAIKVKLGDATAEPSLPSGTNIKLAVVLVPAGASSVISGNISDRRQFVTTVGGVHLWDSSVDGVTYPTAAAGSLRYDLDSANEGAATANTLQYYDGSASAWKNVSILTVSGTGSSSTAAKSDHTHSVDTTYLGITQVRQSDSSSTATPLAIFPSATDTLALTVSRTYKVDAVIYATYTPSGGTAQRIWFDLNPTVAFSSAALSFITWDQVESSTITYSGHETTTNAEFACGASVASGSSDSIVINVSGFVVTSGSATSITPRLYLPTAGNITVLKGSYLRLFDVGTSSVTVINGTWS